MSRALDSLNSILKYKQAREQQRIDRSLSLLDIGTRLKQQELNRQEQVQRMDFARRAESDRAAKARDDNELRDLQRELLYGPQAEKDRERQRKKDELDLKIQEENFNNIVTKKIGEASVNFFAGVDITNRNIDATLASAIKKQTTRNDATFNIPSAVWSYFENVYTEEDSKNNIDEFKSNIKELAASDEEKARVDDFYSSNPQSRKAIINSLMYINLSKSVDGKGDYSKLIDTFYDLDFDSSIVDENLDDLKKQIEIHNERKDYYKDAENRSNIIRSISKIVKNNANKDLEGAVERLVEEEKLGIPSPDIIQQLIEEGFSPADIGL